MPGSRWDLFHDQRRALQDAAPDLLLAWHWLTMTDGDGVGLADLFSELRGSPRPSGAEARTTIEGWLEGKACRTRHGEVMTDAAGPGWALAYALAWLSVSGGNSVMPPWVRHQFPEAGRLVRRLRDTACADPACGWCRERHDARKELARWFGLLDFRPEPAGADGRPDAAVDRRGVDGWGTCPRDPAHRDRQVALLPDPGPVPS